VAVSRALRRLAFTVATLITVATVAAAQPASTPASTPAATAVAAVADPLAVKTTSEGWIWAMRYWTPPAQTRDLVGGRAQGVVGIGRWGLAFRADAIGIPGEFAQDQVKTFRAAEVGVAAHRNLWGAGGVVVAAAAGASVARSLETTAAGVLPDFPKAFTAGVGVRVDGPSWWVYAAVGQHQALHGVALVSTYQVRTSDRTALVGEFAVGSRSSFAQLGLAVRAF